MSQAQIRRLKALQFLSQGYSKRKALLLAGYSLHSANQAIRILKAQKMINVLGKMQNELARSGLTTIYVANKLKEWIDAKKFIGNKLMSDYNTQIDGFDRWINIMNDIKK